MATGAASTGNGGNLSPEDAEALRSALLRMKASPASEDQLARVMRELRNADPPHAADALRRLDGHLAQDPQTQRAVLELLEVAYGWERTSLEAFTFWWNPRQRRPDGNPSRAPTPAEARELEDLLEGLSAQLGTDVPRDVPYRIDFRQGTARVFPRHDPRWGITTPHLPDSRAVAALVLREEADLPYFIEPLALLAAECRGDGDCEERVLDAARRAVVGGGYIPVLEGLSAEVLGDVDDPAFASALLALHHLRRLHPPGVLAALMSGLRRGVTEREATRLISRQARLSPKRLDREVQRELREWALQQAR